jgi:hypothetical protein
MKLRAEIVVDIEAANYLEAAEHQRKLESLLKDVKTRYATAQLQIRERRKRNAHLSTEASTEAQPAPRVVPPTNGKK